MGDKNKLVEAGLQNMALQNQKKETPLQLLVIETRPELREYRGEKPGQLHMGTFRMVLR